MSRVFYCIFIFLIYSNNIYAGNNQKSFSGNYQCGIGSDATCMIGDGSFPVSSDVGKLILDSCNYDDDCCVTGIVDEYDNILKVLSVGKCGEEPVIQTDNPGGNATPGASLFDGFRGYKWRQKININSKDKNFIFLAGSSASKDAIFAKVDENRTLGDVKLGNVFYQVKNQEFVGVTLNWKDNENYDVGRQVGQMVADQVDGFEPISDDKGFHFEKNGLYFQFSLTNNGQNLVGSLEISVNDITAKVTPKGTF